MLKRTIDFKQPFRCVQYLRMSSEGQNKRSPDQQAHEIERVIRMLQLPWQVVKTYRDDAESGRYLRTRFQYQQMMRDLKLGLVTADLILVDTFERFGRAKQVGRIRDALWEKCGVLILTADTNFADPTTPQGQVMGSFEAVRASEDNRIKAHNVNRGKRDAALQKHWPGGPVPFGFRLKRIMIDRHGFEEVDHSILVPNPRTDWITRLLFREAAATGKGQSKLSQWLNDNPDIPAEFKPFQGATIGDWLDNPIYIGTLRWFVRSTDVIDDSRVIEINPAAEVLFVENFCEGIVPREDWDKVQATRDARRKPRENSGNGKLIRPLAPGQTLKYMLTGLVRCGICKRAMTPSSSAYTTAAGEERHYVFYHCPANTDGSCPNGLWIPEEWLRTQVVGRLRDRLLPTG